jgi:hypothetical protein
VRGLVRRMRTCPMFWPISSRIWSVLGGSNSTASKLRAVRSEAERLQRSLDFFVFEGGAGVEQ